jgi:hypothetical protein
MVGEGDVEQCETKRNEPSASEPISENEASGIQRTAKKGDVEATEETNIDPVEPEVDSSTASQRKARSEASAAVEGSDMEGESKKRKQASPGKSSKKKKKAKVNDADQADATLQEEPSEAVENSSAQADTPANAEASKDGSVPEGSTENPRETEISKIVKALSSVRRTRDETDSTPQWKVLRVKGARVTLKHAFPSSEDAEEIRSVTSEQSRGKRSEYTGVGINRIRISPVEEQRSDGSVSYRVVKRLLVQYGLAEGDIDPSSLARKDESSFDLPDEEDGEADQEVENPTVSTEPELVEPELHGDEVAGEARPKLIHDVNVLNQHAYRRRPAKTTALDPILLDEEEDGQLPKSLRHLQPDSKINLISRRTGKVLSGTSAVRVRELPELLKKHAALEPIVPPPGFDPR